MWGAIKKAINSDLTTPLNNLLDTLLGRLSTTRANNLDNLNATISSRQPDVLTSTQANRLDINVGSRLPGTTTHRDRIDTSISSRSSHSAASVWSVATRTLTSAPSPIKSVQRGATEMDAGVHLVNTTISSVTLSKSFVIFSLRTTYSGTSSRHHATWSTGRLTSSTNLRFERAGDDGDEVLTFAWEIVEFT